MDKLAKYQELVEGLIRRYAEADLPQAEIETQLLIDAERGHYSCSHIY
jgi:XisI protein